jgi:hypothetical protein
VNRDNAHEPPRAAELTYEISSMLVCNVAHTLIQSISTSLRVSVTLILVGTEEANVSHSFRCEAHIRI